MSDSDTDDEDLTARPRAAVSHAQVVASDTEDEDLSVPQKSAVLIDEPVPQHDESGVEYDLTAPIDDHRFHILEAGHAGTKHTTARLAKPESFTTHIPAKIRSSGKCLSSNAAETLRKPLFGGKPLNPDEDVLLGRHVRTGSL